MTTTTKHEYVGVKMFESRKAQELFIQMVDVLGDGPAKEDFVAEVKELFDKKVTSEPGEYSVFKITEQDLLDIVHNN